MKLAYCSQAMQERVHLGKIFFVKIWYGYRLAKCQYDDKGLIYRITQAKCMNMCTAKFYEVVFERH